MFVDLPASGDQAMSLLRIVRHCYELALLKARQSAGASLATSDASRLRDLEQLLEGDPSEHRRRRHQRFPLLLPVLLKSSSGSRNGTLLNIGGSGMFVASEAVIPVGETVQVRLGKQNEVEYTFPCRVQWVSKNRSSLGMGLSFSGVPLELRRGFQKAA
jgi:hypothetical protein